MKQRRRIPRKRATPRRKRPELFGGHGIRLHGKAKEARRAEIFARAGGRCEEFIEERWYRNYGFESGVSRWRCPNPAAEWSHNRHGSNKCDCMECGIASCRECHRRRHSLKSGKVEILKQGAA